VRGFDFVLDNTTATPVRSAYTPGLHALNANPYLVSNAKP
jgi:hypothetical protein